MLVTNSAGFRTIAIALMLAAPAMAQAASGSASLTGSSKLVTRGCGRERAAFSALLLVQDDGTWTAQGGDDSFAGTYVAVGRTGRRLVVTLDAGSEAAFIASIAADVTILCESAATVTSSRPKILALILNRKLTKAKLVVKYAFTGTAAGRTGTATYRLIGRGPWTPG